MSKQCWEVRSLDVWGNQEDGYEVNETFHAGELCFTHYPSADQIFARLKTDGLIKSSVKRSEVDVDTNGPDYYDINDAATGEPLFTVTRVDSAGGGKRRKAGKGVAVTGYRRHWPDVQPPAPSAKPQRETVSARLKRIKQTMREVK
jgi:hypothetical protein